MACCNLGKRQYASLCIISYSLFHSFSFWMLDLDMTWDIYYVTGCNELSWVQKQTTSPNLCRWCELIWDSKALWLKLVLFGRSEILNVPTSSALSVLCIFQQYFVCIHLFFTSLEQGKRFFGYRLPQFSTMINLHLKFTVSAV